MFPMLVTVPGIVTLVRLGHQEKASVPILEIPLESEALVKLSQ